MHERFDVVVVGSGPSGGRIALDLARAGTRCLVLEAGDELTAYPMAGTDARAFPGNERGYSTQMFWGGGIELAADARMAFLRARCVGGTSVVNQALMDRFDPATIDDWRARSGIEWLDAAQLATDYDAVEADLDIVEIPERHHNRNTKLFTEAFAKAGFGWAPLRRAQGDCGLDRGSDCIVCLGGCPRESKQSSLVTSLRSARHLGAIVRARHDVQLVEEFGDRVRISGITAGRPFQVEAGAVVLAAGALGTTSVLLRSGLGPRLPALGTRFACHPQVMTFARFDDPVDAHKGAFQAVKSHDPQLREWGLKFENVFAPPIGTSMLLPARGVELLRAMGNYRHLASMEVAIRDDATGTLSLDRKRRLRIDKRLTSDDQRRIDHGLELAHSMFESVGAREIVPCTDTFGLHLMGGCALGVDASTSVVGPDFRVHGLTRTFTADSSIFPSAPGINPSLTIMALSHRASASVAEAVA